MCLSLSKKQKIRSVRKSGPAFKSELRGSEVAGGH